MSHRLAGQVARSKRMHAVVVTLVLAFTIPACAQVSLAKYFSVSLAPVGSQFTLTLRIQNNGTEALTGMAVSDTFPPSLALAEPLNVSNSCGGSVTSTTSSAGTPLLTLANGTLPTGSTGGCTISVNVMGTEVGILTNATSSLTTAQGFTAPSALATVPIVGSQGPALATNGLVPAPAVFSILDQDLVARLNKGAFEAVAAVADEQLTGAALTQLLLSKNPLLHSSFSGIGASVYPTNPLSPPAYSGFVASTNQESDILAWEFHQSHGTSPIGNSSPIPLGTTPIAPVYVATPALNLDPTRIPFSLPNPSAVAPVTVHLAALDSDISSKLNLSFTGGVKPPFGSPFWQDPNPVQNFTYSPLIKRTKDSALNDQRSVVDPFVNTQTGSLITVIRTDTQVGLNSTLPWVLMNNSGNNTLDSPLGFGWRHSYDMSFSFPSAGELAAVFPDGTTRVFNCPSAAPSACTSAAPEEDHYRVSVLVDGSVQVTKTGSDQKVGQLNSAGQLVSVGFPNPTQTLTYDASGNLTKITDSSGRTFTFTSDVTGHIISATDGAGRVSSYTYATSGDLSQVTDPLGHKIQFTYDAGHHLTQVINARGNLTSITYDTQGRVIQVKDALSFTQSFSYASGVTTITDGDGHATEHMYDANRRLTGIKDALGFTRSVTRDADDHIRTMTDPLGNTWNFTYDADGNLTSIKDPDSQTASFTYDANDNLLTATDRLGHTTTLTYNANNYVTEEKYADGTADNYTYNASNELTAWTNANAAMTKYSYDATGDVMQITDAIGSNWKRAYNAVGQPVSLTDPLSHTTLLSYDKLDHIIKISDPLGDSTKFTYDADGNRTSLTDANGHKTLYTYDARDFLTKVTDPLGHTDARTYDGNGNLTSYKDAAGHAMTYSYDADNRGTKVVDPLGDSNLYDYDAVGNSTGLTDGNGGANTFTYDALDRLTMANLSDSSTIGYKYDAEGHLTHLTDSTGSSVYEYDALYRLTSAMTPEGTVGLGYDAVGNRISQTLPGGKVNKYTYDAANRMIDAVDRAGAKTVYNYDTAGHLTRAMLGNGAVANYTYDNAGRLVDVVNTAGATTVSSFSYVLDAVGNKLKVTSGTAVTQYAYDALNRLTSWTPPTGPVTTYTYDAAGNRLTSGGENFTYDAANRMLTAGASAMTSDHNGNLLSDGQFIYHYDALNRLTSVSGAGVSAEYKYDGIGRRVQQQVGTGIIHYLNDPLTGQVLTETGAAGNFTYFFGLGRISARSSSLMYYQYDGSGNVASVTGSADTLLTNYTYSPWGQATASMAGVKNHYQFAADAIDPGTGFIYMSGRYYRSDLGRFFSQGPLGGSPNLYPYQGSNPVR
jgi:RHS repeat-associated protein